MGQRIDLQNVLSALDTSVKAYYQPPTGYKLTYPCIVYELSSRVTRFANDMPYGWKNKYSITYISRTPDDEILDSIGNLQGCKFDRVFVNENLYHYVYNIQY